MTGTERLSPLPSQTTLRRLLERLNAPCDGAGLGAFRVLLGALLCLSVGRFWAYGWIEQLYLEPSFHFTYLGFDWVRPWPAWGMYAHFALMAAAAVAVCVGFFSRASALIFCLTFTYAELIEKASYLNHYYFVSLVTLLLSFMPSGASLLGRRLAATAARTGAGGRCGSGATPCFERRSACSIFSRALPSSTPTGYCRRAARHVARATRRRARHRSAARYEAAAIVASYAGAAYDLTHRVLALLAANAGLRVRRGRGVSRGVWLLFPIGVFSWVMLVATTSFFDPGWPWRYLRSRPELDAGGGAARARVSSARQPSRSWLATSRSSWPCRSDF